jgi:hypothetical protein
MSDSKYVTPRWVIRQPELGRRRIHEPIEGMTKMTDIRASGPPRQSGHQSTTDAAKEQTKIVGQSARSAGGDVVESAKGQTQRVVSETGRQAQNLYGQVRSQVQDQASSQQKRAVDGLYALRDEVGKMADQGGQSGPATHVARQASTKINQVAQWLDGREPGHVLDEVKMYARRNPGTFLLGAAVLGVLAGRMTKNLAGDSGGRGADASAYTGREAYVGDSSYSTGAPYSTGAEPYPGDAEHEASTATYVSGSATSESAVPSAQPMSTATTVPAATTVPPGGGLDTPTEAMPPLGYADDEERP